MYTIKVEADKMKIVLMSDESSFEHIIEKDKYNDLVIKFFGNSEKITRYNSIQEIVEDRDYILKTLESYDKSGDFGNICEDLFYGKHFKGLENNKIIVIEDDKGYETTFDTFLGSFTFQNDSCIEIGKQINIFTNDEYIGTLEGGEYIDLGDLNVYKMKNVIENYLNYLNNLSPKTYTCDNKKIELIKMVMRLFPNKEIEE